MFSVTRRANFGLTLTTEKLVPIRHATKTDDSHSPSTGMFSSSRKACSPGSKMLPIRKAS